MSQMRRDDQGSHRLGQRGRGGISFFAQGIPQALTGPGFDRAPRSWRVVFRGHRGRGDGLARLAVRKGARQGADSGSRPNFPRPGVSHSRGPAVAALGRSGFEIRSAAAPAASDPGEPPAVSPRGGSIPGRSFLRGASGNAASGRAGKPWYFRRESGCIGPGVDRNRGVAGAPAAASHRSARPGGGGIEGLGGNGCEPLPLGGQTARDVSAPGWSSGSLLSHRRPSLGSARVGYQARP